MGFIPLSLVLRSIVWDWILIYRNWSILSLSGLYLAFLIGVVLTFPWSYRFENYTSCWKKIEVWLNGNNIPKYWKSVKREFYSNQTCCRKAGRLLDPACKLQHSGSTHLMGTSTEFESEISAPNIFTSFEFRFSGKREVGVHRFVSKRNSDHHVLFCHYPLSYLAIDASSCKEFCVRSQCMQWPQANNFFRSFFYFWVGRYNKTLNDWPLGKQWVLFPLDLNVRLGEWASRGIKTHCFPCGQSLSAYCWLVRWFAWACVS